MPEPVPPDRLQAAGERPDLLQGRSLNEAYRALVIAGRTPAEACSLLAWSFGIPNTADDKPLTWTIGQIAILRFLKASRNRWSG